jgi:hypothetical protein
MAMAISAASVAGMSADDGLGRFVDKARIEGGAGGSGDGDFGLGHRNHPAAAARAGTRGGAWGREGAGERDDLSALVVDDLFGHVIHAVSLNALRTVREALGSLGACS